MRLVAFLAIAVSTAFANTAVHYYPYDDSDAISSRFMFAGKDIKVRKARARLLADYACGAWHGAFEGTSGYTLHLFPDRRVMLEWSCDIGPMQLVAEGKWMIEGDSVRIDWMQWKLGEQNQQLFVESHGECKSLHLYLCFNENEIFLLQNVYLASSDKEGKAIEFPLVQVSKYVNWQAIADQLKKKG